MLVYLSVKNVFIVKKAKKGVLMLTHALPDLRPHELWAVQVTEVCLSSLL
jgi:hypothetical protein